MHLMSKHASALKHVKKYWLKVLKKIANAAIQASMQAYEPEIKCYKICI